MRLPGIGTPPRKPPRDPRGTKIGAIAVAAGLALAACGSGDDAGRFDQSVGEIRSAVIAGDRTAATELDGPTRAPPGGPGTRSTGGD